MTLPPLWSCPPPDPASRYLHFTSPGRARRIVGCGYLLRGDPNVISAVRVGGWWRPEVFTGSTSIVRVLGPKFQRPLPPSAKTAAVLFRCDRPPDVCGPFEAQWRVARLVLADAVVVSIGEARELLDGRLHAALRNPDGSVWCPECARVGCPG